MAHELKRKLDDSDALATPNDGKRYELVRGEVFDAPLDVILSPHDVLEPDLLVVGDPDQTTTRNVEKPPLLVVEILSPKTFFRSSRFPSQRF